MSKDPLTELHGELERLRIEFERYFMGLERKMPSAARDRLAQRIRRFDAGQDSVLKFKHRNLVQRLMVLEHYWNRVFRAMEAGTYTRDVARANFKEQRRTDANVRPAQTKEQRAKSKKNAEQVGAQAQDFLDQLQSSPGHTGGIPAQLKGLKLEMRGRAKRSVSDSDDES